MTSATEVLECLKTGKFEALIGMSENVWLEVKQSPYLLGGDRQKLELAKDISAIANAGGGILVLGFTTQRFPDKPGDWVCAVNLLPLARIDPDQIHKILSDRVYPPLTHIDVRVFPSGQDSTKGVAAIVVNDAGTSASKPYLVAKMLDEDDGVLGTQFGYFERTHDRVPTTSVARLQQLLSAGQSFSAIHERLISMESSIASLKLPAAKADDGGIRNDVLEERVRQAIAAAERTGRPVLCLTAASQESCDFPGLFGSRADEVVRLIESPPMLRADGFWIGGGQFSEIIEGRLRRSVRPGQRLLELWKDGALIFIGQGDEDFLGWFGGHSPHPIKINNYVLAEAILMFCWLTKMVFAEAEPRPRILRLAVGFENLTRDGNAALLDDIPFKGMPGIDEPRKAPSGKHEVSWLADWETFDFEKGAYALYGGIYNWFGYNSPSVPYIDRNGSEPKLSAQALLGKPMPLRSDFLLFR